jgi:O-antigen ligase
MELMANFAGFKGGRIVLGLAFTIFCLAIVAIILNDPDLAIVVLLAISVGFFVVKQPAVGVLLTILTTSTIISPQVLPRLSMLGADIDFTELLITLTLLIIFAKYGLVRSLKSCFSSRISFLILLLLILTVCSILYSLSEYKDLDLTTILSRSRSLFYYVLFFPALLVLRDEKDQRFLLKGLLFLTAFVSVYFLFTATFGPTYLHYLLRTGVRFEIHSVDTGSISSAILSDARLRDIPGTALVLTMIFVSLSLTVFNHSIRGAIGYAILSSLFTIPILLTFTRMTWLTSICCFILLCVLARDRIPRLTKLIFIVSGLFVLAFLALTFHPKYSTELVGFTVERFRSLFEDNIATGTGVWRMVENKVSIDILQRSPLWGLGVAGEIVNETVEYGGREYVMVNKMSVHNSYFNLALKIGIPGLVVFLIIYMLSLFRTWKNFREADNVFLKALSIGLFLGLLGTLINAVAHPYFTEIRMIACLTVTFALIETIRRNIRQSNERMRSTGRDVVLSRGPIQPI